jgi:hypothetical protein
MSTVSDPTARDDGNFLRGLIEAELVATPLVHWAYFFPCHVALWRFIEATRPGVVGPLSAGFDTEPYFAGKGADWFYGELSNYEDVLGPVERIMYSATDHLPASAKQRGFLTAGEVPPVDVEVCRQLARAVLSRVDLM